MGGPICNLSVHLLNIIAIGCGKINLMLEIDFKFLLKKFFFMYRYKMIVKIQMPPLRTFIVKETFFLCMYLPRYLPISHSIHQTSEQATRYFYSSH